MTVDMTTCVRCATRYVRSVVRCARCGSLDFTVESLPSLGEVLATTRTEGSCHAVVTIGDGVCVLAAGARDHPAQIGRMVDVERLGDGTFHLVDDGAIR